MKTTYKSRITEEMMEKIKGANTSFLTIDKKIINKALNEGNLEDIGCHTSRSGNENHYYAIMGSNDCLMQVQDDLYCIINRTVYCVSKGKTINVIKELLKYSFYVNNTSCNRYHVVAHSTPDLVAAGHTAKIYLPRVLMALELFGEIKYLDRSYDIHHKGDCYDNRNEVMMYIPRTEHNHSNGHMNGGRIKTYEALLQHFQYLAWEKYRLKDVTTVH